MEVLATATTPDGSELQLRRRRNHFFLFAAGEELMTSETHGSEDALAGLGCARIRAREHPCVLVGGLGMGFTLRAALEALPAGARVVVAELVPAVVEWNRGILGPLAGHPLDDPRVVVEQADVGTLVCQARAAYDAILLDTDNGPAELTDAGNARLYSAAGLAAARQALRPGGCLAVWSEETDPAFTAALQQAGFAVECHRIAASPAPGMRRHTIWTAHLS